MDDGISLLLENLSLTKDPPPTTRSATKKKEEKKEEKKKEEEKKKKKKKKKGKKEKKDVVERFDAYFGDVSKLENWQQLCRDLSIDPVPKTLTQCRKELRGKWVNIYDFLDHKKSNTKQVFFKSERALAAYTVREGKIYPMKLAREGGPVRELLAHIF